MGHLKRTKHHKHCSQGKTQQSDETLDSNLGGEMDLTLPRIPQYNTNSDNNKVGLIFSQDGRGYNRPPLVCIWQRHKHKRLSQMLEPRERAHARTHVRTLFGGGGVENI